MASAEPAISDGAADSMPSLSSVHGQNNLTSLPLTSSANNSSGAVAPEASRLDETHNITGEEHEECILRKDGALFEFQNNQWCTRTLKGRLHLNLNPEGQARIIMRASGIGSKAFFFSP